ncbi:MAG: hypothetical protein WDO06_06910 [Actinomycetota bacterium]
MTSTLFEPSWDEAREASRLSSKSLSSEIIPIPDSIDRINSQDLFALCDLPTYTTSAMDGYAIAGEGPWKILGEVLAENLLNYSSTLAKLFISQLGR